MTEFRVAKARKIARDIRFNGSRAAGIVELKSGRYAAGAVAITVHECGPRPARPARVSVAPQWTGSSRLLRFLGTRLGFDVDGYGGQDAVCLRLGGRLRRRRGQQLLRGLHVVDIECDGDVLAPVRGDVVSDVGAGRSDGRGT